jgi:hypothetical protein
MIFSRPRSVVVVPEVPSAVTLRIVREGGSASDSIEVELPREVIQAVAEIADRDQVSFEVALQQTVQNEKFLDELISKGKKLLVEENGELRELVREPA